MRRFAGALLLLIPVLVGGYLRFDALGGPSFWLDEILGSRLTGEAMSRPWWAWITGFDAEHGPLYYATQAVTRSIDSPEVAGRLPAAVLGLATIAVLGLSGTPVAAALIAVSPLHVYYSREARPYALSMFLAAVALVMMLRTRWLWRPLLVLALMLYTSATAAPFVAAAGIAALITGTRRDRVLGAGALLLACATPLLYRGRSAATFGPPFPDLDVAFFGRLLRSLTVSALEGGSNRTALAVLVLAIFGGVMLFRRDRRGATIVIALAVLPVAIAIAALAFYRHWYAARYVCTALPAYLLLAGIGVVEVGRLARRAQWPVVLVVVGAIAGSTWQAAREEPWQKLDWREIASTIASRAGSNDVVIAAEAWSRVSLGFYLPQRVRLVEVTNPVVADDLVAKNAPVWIATAGYSTTPAVSIWACQSPMVLSSGLESFRLHYAPSLAHFLRERSTQPEIAALAAGAPGGLALHMSHADDLYLGDGWASPEGEGREAFRWVLGTRATIFVPALGKLPLGLRVLPMPDQSVTVRVNGQPSETIHMRSGWNELTIESDGWRAGLNRIDFEFGHAAAPSSIDAKSSDHRLLSAAFDTIRVGGVREDLPVRTVRLAALTPRRTVKTRFDVASLNRGAINALLGRLGFDPEATMPRLLAGTTTLEDLAGTVADASRCEDDLSFARRAYAILMQQVPNVLEDASLVRMQRTGMTRADVVRHIVRKNEFVAKLR